VPKPWAKYEVGFIEHPKFKGLNANAICLWIEGKNYCDLNMTDGLIPAHIVKQFRFSGKKSIDALLASVGPKNESESYAALWEPHPIGYKMHGYLEYNDCREAVLARLEQAERNRELDREYKARARAAKKALHPVDVRSLSGPDKPDNPVDVRLYTETETETTPQGSKEQNLSGGDAPAARPRALSPIHDRSHRAHAVCGRVCLHASLFNDFVRRRNHDDADREVRTWADGVIDAWTDGPFRSIEPGDPFDFWKARYAEQWPAATSNASKKWGTWRPSEAS
jgi:hypothetical protein